MRAPSDEALYVRLRALCCEAWGLSPWAFEEQSAGGLIAFEDVAELLLLKLSDPQSGLAVQAWMKREDAFGAEEKLRRMIALEAKHKREKDPAKRKRIEQEMEALNNA